MIEKFKSAMVGLGASWTLILMLVLSVVSLAVMLERAWLYFSLRDDAAALMKELSRLLRDGDLAGAKKRMEASPSAEAAVVYAGLVEAPRGAGAAEEAMASAGVLQKERLERRLAFLGTLGNNAPFVGLLGTVIGILGAFDELSKAKAAAAGPATAMAPEGVMGAISEALVATAVGLIVAIPAVAAFNYFQRVVKVTLGNTDALGHILLGHLRADGAVALVDTSDKPSKAKSSKAESSKAESSKAESKADAKEEN
jgi:biopolymer transport protein ExbB